MSLLLRRHRAISVETFSLCSTSLERRLVLYVPDAPSDFRNADSRALHRQYGDDEVLKVERRLAMNGENGPGENQLQ